MPTPGLYIHIPFCQSKCPYCGFFSSTDLTFSRDFLTALPKEMAIYRGEFRSFDTVYIGGGTPSLLDPADLEAILAATARLFTIPAGAEITVEANPADLDLAWLQGARQRGINRLNVGVQSFDDEVLSFLGRRHNRRQAIAALEAARAAGFDNLGMDLIYGVPGQDLSIWQETLAMALAFAPEHLSCYQLTVEAGTPLARRQAMGEIITPGEDELAEFFFQTSATLKRAGYIHYEVSNFARHLSLPSRHNQKYWDHTPYLGLGPAAHSFKKNRRWWNRRDLKAYLSDVERGLPPQEGEEVLTEEQLRLEALFLGLRTGKGIDLLRFARRYGCDLLKDKAEGLTALAAGRLVEIKKGRLVPTPAGLAVADSLALL